MKTTRNDLLRMGMTGLCVMMINGVSEANPSAGTGLVFPKKDWVEATPESQGVDAAKLEEAMCAIAALHPKGEPNAGSTQAVVIRNGRMIWKGSDIDNLHLICSCTKSFVNSVFGLLYDDGKCRLETRAADVLPAMKEYYPEATLGQFANLTSGYNVPWNTSPFEIRPPLHPPGKAIHYSDSVNQLAHLLTLVAGQPLRDLFKQRIADVIGMPPDAWRWDDSGEVNGLKVCGAGLVSTTARNFARFGLLYLAEGRWEDRQVVSKEWVRLSTTAQVAPTLPTHLPSSCWYNVLPGRYGYNWWTNGIDAKGERLWPSAPPRTFAAQGNYNNYCFVIPEWQMVFVTMDTSKVVDAKLYDRVFSQLREAIR